VSEVPLYAGERKVVQRTALERTRNLLKVHDQILVMAEEPLHKRETVSEREFFIDNLLVRIRLIIEMTLVDRPCAMGV